jgi:hypothetical protein
LGDLFEKNTKVAVMFGLLFPWLKMGWAIFWAIFSQTHLVTLTSLETVRTGGISFQTFYELGI